MIFSFINSLCFTANQKILAKGGRGQVSVAHFPPLWGSPGRSAKTKWPHCRVWLRESLGGVSEWRQWGRVSLCWSLSDPAKMGVLITCFLFYFVYSFVYLFFLHEEAVNFHKAQELYFGMSSLKVILFASQWPFSKKRRGGWFEHSENNRVAGTSLRKLLDRTVRGELKSQPLIYPVVITQSELQGVFQATHLFL